MAKLVRFNQIVFLKKNKIPVKRKTLKLNVVSEMLLTAIEDHILALDHTRNTHWTGS